jgi:tetratricopeptide (TPR) repeat protein
MSSTNQKDINGFLDQWKRHPMSIPIIILLTNSSFLLILIQGNVNINKIYIALMSCIFNLIILLVVVVVLLWKKFVFYNATELVVTEVDKYIRNINDSLSDVEIGYGIAFDHLRAPPINNDVHTIIRNFELLTNILKNINYEFDGNDITKKSLAKYYFRTKNFKKALDWAEKVKDKKDSEYNFIKGLLLWNLKESEKAREYFTKSSHENAIYYKMLTYINRTNQNESDLNYFISEVSKTTSPLFSNFFAQLNLGTAYWQKATMFPSEGKVVDLVMLEKALANAERLMPRDTYGFAYYNAACYKSLLGKHYEATDSPETYDQRTCCDQVIQYLTKASNLGSFLVKHAVSDHDFEWIKEKCPSSFYEIIGANCRQCAGGK